jgi:hypothetical protein
MTVHAMNFLVREVPNDHDLCKTYETMRLQTQANNLVIMNLILLQAGNLSTSTPSISSIRSHNEYHNILFNQAAL